jgi:hypothetical protein
MIAAALVAGQLATAPSGSYIDDIRQTVIIVYKNHLTYEQGGYDLSTTVKYKHLKDGTIEFKAGGRTYKATLKSNGKLAVTAIGAKGTFSGVYVH